MSGAGSDAAPLVRRTAVADWQALRAVRLRALDQDPDAFGSTYALALALPDEEYRRRAASRTTHLAFSDGEPVGIVTLVPSDDGDPAQRDLVSMWVDPSHRGTGLAQRLVEAACARGRIDGVREVALWVTAGNAAARGLYERCGFTLTGHRQPVRPDQPERLEEQMRRVLVPDRGASEMRGALKNASPAPRSGMNAQWSTSADQVDDQLRGQLVRCWRDVSNAGGAVGFPVIPVDEAEVREAVAALLVGLSPSLQELLVIVDQAEPPELLGWLVLVGNGSTLTAHWARVIRVQTALDHRGRGVGRALMEEVARRAGEDLGLLQLHLELRGGAGLEGFYSGLGWREIGAWPGALRIGDGELRDEVLMMLDLT